MKWTKKILFVISFVLVLQFAGAITVCATEGKLYIMLSDSSMAVGDTLKVTLSAVGANQENASADMVFTYDTEVFSFVSCDTENYSGGSGGSLSVRGSSVVVTLKTVGSGSGYMKVTGSNGVVRESGASLESIVAAGATVQVSGQQSGTESSEDTSQEDGEKSNDNSLSELRLSAGELSPEFQYSTTNYTATVSGDVSSIEVTAVPSNEKAQIESISGNTQLQMGENTISVKVKAENGDVSVYTIVVTKEQGEVSQTEESPESNQEQSPVSPEDAGISKDTTQELGMTDQQIEEYENKITLLSKEYTKLEEKYNRERASHIRILAVLIFVIVFLVILCINLLIFRNRREEDFDYDEPDFTEEKKTRKEKKHAVKRDMDWLDEGLEDEWARQEYERLNEEEENRRHIDFIDFEDL